MGLAISSHPECIPRASFSECKKICNIQTSSRNGADGISKCHSHKCNFLSIILKFIIDEISGSRLAQHFSCISTVITVSLTGDHVGFLDNFSSLTELALRLMTEVSRDRPTNRCWPKVK